MRSLTSIVMYVSNVVGKFQKSRLSTVDVSKIQRRGVKIL